MVSPAFTGRQWIASSYQRGFRRSPAALAPTPICPPHNISFPAHFVRKVIRFHLFRFARILPSPIVLIHRIPFTFS